MVEKITYGPWLTDTGFRWKDDTHAPWSCIDILKQYFTLPETVTKIRFYATNKPASNNYRFNLVDVHVIKIRSVTLRLYPELYYFLREALLDNEQHYFGVEYI